MTGSPVSLLDNIRISDGPEILRNYFSELLHTSRNRLPELLSDRRLHFGTLYLLKSEIKSSGLQDTLPDMYRKALELSEELSGTGPGDTRPAGRRPGTRPSYGHRAGYKGRNIGVMLSDAVTVRSLGWIVRTGWDSDMPEGPYECLMERCTSLLLAHMRYKSFLPLIADKIFERNRQGRLIHNLVWAFFEARDRESLYFLAHRLCSPDMRDAMLARKLLGFIPGTDDYSADSHVLYINALGWLSVNMPFMYYTGESLQMSPKPVFYAVSYEAKYLCRKVPADSGRPAVPPDKHEAGRLECFRRLDETQRQLLADVSYALFMQDKRRWESWIRLPVRDQLESAVHMTGGSA